MASIRIISTSRVCAASDKQSNLRIDLPPWDLRKLLIDYSQKGLLFHKPKHEKEPENTYIQHLKSSLSRTLDLFDPLAGRLATIKHDDNSTCSFFIDCNNAGAEFVHASADGVFVADIIQPIYVPKIVYSFFPLNGVRSYEGTTKPLLAVQITELVDGTFLGISVNHTVVDATSFWHFVNSWSEISRGYECLSKPAPILERWFLHEQDCPIHIPLLITSEQLKNRYVPPRPLEQRVFHFSKENVAKLKAKANAEIDTNRISSLQALLGHFFRSLVRNTCIDHPDQEMNIRLPVGIRPRMNPPLPQHYFGNAGQAAVVSMKARELLEKGLGYVACEINKSIAMQTDEKFKDMLESWTKNPNVTSIDSWVSNGLIFSGSLWEDIYGNDFGWGRPIAVRTGPSNKIDGFITMFPGVEQASIDFEACISFETLRGMGSDTEFMDSVTST